MGSENMRELFDWANEDSRTFMARNESYLKKGETVESRARVIADAAEKLLGIEGFADKFYKYLGLGYYSLSSPVWSNFGTNRGLPISCNGVYVPDDMAGIMDKLSEVGIQTKQGAGTSGYFNHIRPRGTPINTGGTADGPVHFMRLFETAIDVISQGNVRRGSMAAYVDIDHPDIEEFLQIREVGSAIQHLSIGICISNAWMSAMEQGDADKRKVWAKVLRKRRESGYPYLFFSDNVNDNKPQVLKDKNIPIHASNLCAEIAQPSSDIWSFVCCLMSMNDLFFDEWKDTDAVEVAIMFLDAVTEEYIRKTANMKHMEASHNYAKHWRALGLGRLGWHSYLQSKMIPFESMKAEMLDVQIQKFIDEKSLKASKELAVILGEPEGMKGYGERNLTRQAIAPTTSSSFIHGQVSPSIEPLRSNYFTKDLAKGKFTYRNPWLKEVLASHGKDDDETWLTILHRGGSVQHLEFLTQKEKDVFKTFDEISPMTIVTQAANRQKYIDQSQSLNLLIPDGAPIKDVNALIMEGWRRGIKTFYYQRSTNPAQELVRDILTCSSCEA